MLLDLAYYLCPAAEPKSEQDRRAVSWAGRMAVLAGRPVIERDTEARDGGTAFLDRLVRRLTDLLASTLPPVERAEAGVVLAQLGDLRAEVMTVADMALCDVPAGRFLTGSRGGDKSASADEQPQHEIELPAFRIGKYPVTNAQFGEFVKEGGYRETRFWEEARSARAWKNGRVKDRFDREPRDGPATFGSPYDLPNHPVVGITWYEALAFTRWLTEIWRKNARIGLQDIVTLPSEAEWEKAARGTDGRRYPWGKKPDPQRANFRDTGIGTTNTVGCFPGGASPYGVEEMSGNVWEWTRSLWGPDYSKPKYRYPYDATDGREDLAAGENVLRVLRGGWFNFTSRLVRCAFRIRYLPYLWFNLIGFRVVSFPFCGA
jgi:formylglycine-generating enzyme required for sulfatase activity